MVRIFGPDLATLRGKAEEVAAVMKGVKGVSDLKVDAQILVPQLDVALRPDAASRLGLTAGDVRRSATTLVKGTKVGEVYRDQKIFDVFVWGVGRVRDDASAVHTLPIEFAKNLRSRATSRRHCRACSKFNPARGLAKIDVTAT